MSTSKYLFRESVAAPGWLAAVVFGGMALVGFLIGLEAVRGSLAGGERVLFYVFMTLALVVQGFVAANFLVLNVIVTPERVEFAYGLFRRRFAWAQVSGVSVERYDWKRYGGWGLRFHMHGRRAWSVPGVPGGVAFQVESGGKRREYFVSSRRPEELARSVAQVSGRPLPQSP
jgi:hypothetical protein